jgi:putative hydrolase of the HAD superfamily
VNTGLVGRFVSIHISAECGHAKPAREIFSLACRTAGVEPHDAVYVGDLYEIDAVGARQAGLRGIWLDRSKDGGAQFAPPIIHGLGELVAALHG